MRGSDTSLGLFPNPSGANYLLQGFHEEIDIRGVHARGDRPIFEGPDMRARSLVCKIVERRRCLI